MHPPGADVVLIRHGELGVKSDQVRRKMEDRLAENLGAMFDARGLSGDIERRRNRIFVHTDTADAVADAAADTFGVVSASPARTVEPTPEAIETALVAATDAELEEVQSLASFTTRYSTMLHASEYDIEQFKVEMAQMADHLQAEAGED